MQPLTEGLMNGPLRRALKLEDICREQGRIGWHDLRHTYANHLAMNGSALTFIKEMTDDSPKKENLLSIL